MTLSLAIIGAIVCALGLIIINSHKKWQEMTKPPKGWMQHKGFRTRIPKNRL